MTRVQAIITRGPKLLMRSTASRNRNGGAYPVVLLKAAKRRKKQCCVNCEKKPAWMGA